MSKQAKSSLQSSYAFALTKTDSADVVADANNLYQYPWVYVNVVGVSGNVQITPVDGQNSYNILTTLGAITGGSGYTNGTYSNVNLVWKSGTISQPALVNITVASGAVSAITYVNGGVGADTTTVWTCNDTTIGSGSGFSVVTSSVTAQSDKIVVYGVQGTMLGGAMPIMVKRVWSTNTAAGNLVGFVGRGGSF